MTLFELLVFLAVTAAIGAIVGTGVGLFAGGLARGALIGAFASPVAVACGIQLYLLISGRRKSGAHKDKEE